MQVELQRDASEIAISKLFGNSIYLPINAQQSNNQQNANISQESHIFKQLH